MLKNLHTMGIPGSGDRQQPCPTTVGRQSHKRRGVRGDTGDNSYEAEVQKESLVLSNAVEMSPSKKYPTNDANSNFFVIK